MNIINVAKGLLNQWDQVKDVDKKLAGQVKEQLAAIADDVREAVGELRGLVDPATIEREDGERVPTASAEDIRATGRRLDEVVSGKTPGAGSAASDSTGKRTTAAAAAPNKA